MANQNRKLPGSQRPSARTARNAPVDRPAELPDLWAIGIFLLVTLVFFWNHIAGSAFLWEDFAEFTYPNEVFAARSFMSGVIPFWNPFTFNGMPFLADLQIGFFYPGNLLMYFLSGGELGSWLGQFFVVIHYLIAMIGMWRLARGIGIGSWGAVFAGIAYALCAMMVVHMIHPNMIQHLAWFPLIVYFFYRGLTEGSWLHSILAGIILGIALLSGHPQSALYIVLFLFALTIFVVVRDLRSDEPEARSGLITRLLAAALPIVIGVGIFAVQLLPSQELAGLSERAEISYEKSLEGALGGGQLFTLIVPKVFGVAGPDPAPELPFWYRPETYYFWETAIYIGVVTLLLAIVGLASRRLGGLGWFLGGMGLLGLLYALGDSFLIHPIIGRLPLFSSFRIPTRMAIYLAFGGALLAGVGLERIVRGGDWSERLEKVVLLVGGVIALIGLMTIAGVIGPMLGAPDQIAGKVGPTGIVALLVGGGAAAVAWAALKNKIPATATALILLLLGVIDLFAFGMGLNNAPDDPEQIYQRNDAQFAAFKVAPPEKLFRVKMREGGAMLMQRNQGQYSGIMLYEGYNPLLLQRRVPPTANPAIAYDLLNIAYDVQIDTQAQQLRLLERPSRYPHARMLYDARLTNAEGSAPLMKGGEVDFARTVVLEEDPGVKLDGAGSGTATVTRYDAAEIEVKVTTDKPGILLLSEIWYPTWNVTIDGAPARLLRANHSLRGVAVPAGAHTVVMRYESGAYNAGLWITIVTLLASIAGAVILWLRRRKVRNAE